MSREKNIIIASGFASVICGSFLSVAGVVLVRISASLGLNTQETGLFLSVNFIGYMTLVFLGGALVGQLGAKRLLILATIGECAAAMFMAFSPGFFGCAIGTFLIGGCSGILESMGCAVLGSLDAGDSDRYVNLSSIFVALGYFLGSALGGIAMIFTDRWRFIYVVLMALAVICLFVLRATSFEDIMPKESSPRATRKSLCTVPFMLCCLCMMLYVGIEVTIFNWLTTYLIDEAQVGILLSTATICAFYLALVFGRAICGKLLSKWSSVTILTVLPCISFAAIMIIVQADSVLLIFLSSVLLGFVFSSIAPFIVSMGANISHSSAAYSTVVGSGGIGTVIIPSVVGFIGERLSVKFGIFCVAPSLLLIAFLVFFILRHKQIST